MKIMEILYMAIVIATATLVSYNWISWMTGEEPRYQHNRSTGDSIPPKYPSDSIQK